MDMAAILKMRIFTGVERGTQSNIFQHNNQQNKINAPNTCILDLVVK